MLFYIFLVGIFYILFTLSDYRWPNNWQKKFLQISPCALLFFVAVFRFDVGYDYPAYYGMATSTYTDELDRIEPFSRYIIECAKYLGHPYILFILFGIPTYCIVFWFCSKTKSFQLAFWTYVCLFLLESFGTIRQAAAMSIILCAIVYLTKKKIVPYILLCLLASLFHFTAIIMLPIYFVYYYIPLKIVLICSISLVLFFPLIISILLSNNIYTYYLYNNELYEGGGYIRFFYVILYLILLAIAYKKSIFPETKRIFTVLMPAFFIPFLFGGHLGGRLSSYLYLFFILLIPQVLSFCNTKIKILFMAMLCTFFFALLYISERAGDKSPYTPYKTIFEVDLKHPVFK